MQKESNNMASPVDVEFDTTFGTAYVQLSGNAVESTDELSACMFVDRDSAGEVVGIEHIDLKQALPVDELAETLNLDTAQVAALYDAQHRLMQLMNSKTSFSTDGTISAQSGDWNTIPA